MPHDIAPKYFNNGFFMSAFCHGINNVLMIIIGPKPNVIKSKKFPDKSIDLNLNTKYEVTKKIKQQYPSFTDLKVFLFSYANANKTPIEKLAIPLPMALLNMGYANPLAISAAPSIAVNENA